MGVPVDLRFLIPVVRCVRTSWVYAARISSLRYIPIAVMYRVYSALSANI